MQRTVIDENGDVRCPKCNARSSFSEKRTGKAKWIGFLTLGVGLLAMPKRLKCNGCGVNLKRSKPVYRPSTQAVAATPAAQQAPPATAWLPPTETPSQ